MTDKVIQTIVMRAKYPDGNGGTRKLRSGKYCAQASYASMAFLAHKWHKPEFVSHEPGVSYETVDIPQPLSEEEKIWLEDLADFFGPGDKFNHLTHCATVLRRLTASEPKSSEVTADMLVPGAVLVTGRGERYRIERTCGYGGFSFNRIHLSRDAIDTRLLLPFANGFTVEPPTQEPKR